MSQKMKFSCSALPVRYLRTGRPPIPTLHNTRTARQHQSASEKEQARQSGENSHVNIQRSLPLYSIFHSW